MTTGQADYVPRPKKARPPVVEGAPAREFKYVNDGSYKSIELQLFKLSIGMHKRLLALGIPWGIEDVQQELRESYVRALAKWTPEKSRFSTYFQTAAVNNFNNRVAKVVREKALMGMFSYDSQKSPGSEDSGKTFADPLNTFTPQESDDSTPEGRIEARQALNESFRYASNGCRRLMSALLASQNSTQWDVDGKPPKLSELTDMIGLAGDELRQVKLEIARKFGVRWS